ncbi:MAG: caspase domain-containing protein [Hyphomicrobiales bacterium]
MASYKLSQGLRAFGLVALACLIALAFAVPVHAGEHHALVIGIERYERARDLRNPVNDARAVADRLQALGFALHGGQAHVNPDRATMLALMRDFAAKIPDGATAVVFLAGHGLSQGGDTYLVPADDAALRTRADLDARGVALRTLTGRLAARTGVHSIVLVDACSANGLRGGGPGAGGAGDLVTSATGSMSLMYAAAPGQIAADGEGSNSPFTAALLHALEAPHEPLAVLFRQVARHLQVQSDGAQTPWMVRSYGEVAPVYLTDR